MHAPTQGSLLDFAQTPLSPPILSHPAVTLKEHRSDWPGRGALTLGLSGCDLRCPYCSVPEQVTDRTDSTSFDDLLGRIVERRASFDGVVISGGEPTRFRGLPGFVRAISALGLPVKLDTAGTHPEVLAETLRTGAVTFVSLDIKTLPERYDSVTGGTCVWVSVAESLSLLIDSGIDHELRTTCYPFAITPPDLPRLASHLVGGQRYVLQQFSPRRTLDPAASSVRPFSANELRAAALRCSVHLPTALRGV